MIRNYWKLEKFELLVENLCQELNLVKIQSKAWFCFLFFLNRMYWQLVSVTSFS